MASRLPLHGVTVLDLGDEASVLAARLLAELGAEVVRVESLAGDRIRRRGPFAEGQPGLERSLPHLLYNAGKQSVALALEAPEAWEVVDRLLSGVAVAIAPLEKSGLARTFFSKERLAAAHPEAAVVDFIFRRGALDLAVTDLIAVAGGGALYCNGFPDRPPDWPAGRLAYKQASFVAAAAAMALIMSRRLTGRGGHTTISLQEAMMSTTIQSANENLWRWQGAISRRAGMGGLEYPVLGKGGVALIRTSGTTYRAKDGRWVTFAIWPAYWHNFAAWVREATGDDSFSSKEWDEPLHRVQQQDAVDAAIEALCTSLPRDELVERGQQLGMLVLPVNTVADIAADPHLAERGFFRDVWHPALSRSITLPGSAFHSSAYVTEARPAPMLGQHSVSVLRGPAGLAPEEIDRLQELGVVGAPAAAVSMAESAP